MRPLGGVRLDFGPDPAAQLAGLLADAGGTEALLGAWRTAAESLQGDRIYVAGGFPAPSQRVHGISHAENHYSLRITPR